MRHLHPLRVMVAKFVLATLAAADRPDPVAIAARHALDAGHPVAALHLLAGHAARRSPGDVCLISAQASLALGRHDDAIATLGLAGKDDLARWPERLWGAAAAAMGEGGLAGGRIQEARPWLELALRFRGPGVEVDRVLILLAEVSERLDDAKTMERAAHLVWRDWPRSPYRARAGVILARGLSAAKPDEARALLAGVRAIDHVDPATRLVAAELLCHLLLPGKPGQCLVVAEQESALLPNSGRLPLYRALALGELDQREGIAALDVLPASLRDDPAATSARIRWTSAADVAQDVTLRIEHARAQIDLGRTAQARGLLEPLAQTQPAALVVLMQIPDVDPEPWLTVPALEDPAARAAVAIVLARGGDHARAWALFAELVDTPASEGVPVASVWFWAARAAAKAAPTRVEGLTARLLSLDGEGVEIGMAWAEEAQRRERSARSTDDVAHAWGRAGVALPASHPWQPAAIQRAAKHWMQADHRWDETRRLLERVSAVGVSEDHLRCRFLLLQVYERLGMRAQALDLVRGLLPSAGADQREKLERIRARLVASDALEVQPGPLDAEN